MSSEINWMRFAALAALLSCWSPPPDSEDHLLLQPIIGNGPGIEFMDHGTVIGSYAYEFQECRNASTLEICRDGFVPLVWDEFTNADSINIGSMQIQRMNLTSGDYTISIIKSNTMFIYIYDENNCIQYLILDVNDGHSRPETEILYRQRGNLCF